MIYTIKMEHTAPEILIKNTQTKIKMRCKNSGIITNLKKIIQT